jgi:hypothetical protein
MTASMIARVALTCLLVGLPTLGIVAALGAATHQYDAIQRICMYAAIAALAVLACGTLLGSGALVLAVWR